MGRGDPPVWHCPCGPCLLALLPLALTAVMALAARLLAPAARRAARLVLSDSTDAVTNLAIEDWLFRSAEPEAGPLLYCYRNAPTVVLGRNQNQWKQCRMGALRASGVALVRRNSGGGAVYHDLGNSNFCFIGDKEALGDNPGRMRHATLVADALREGFGLPTAVSEERLELVVAPDGPYAGPPAPPAPLPPLLLCCCCCCCCC